MNQEQLPYDEKLFPQMVLPTNLYEYDLKTILSKKIEHISNQDIKDGIAKPLPVQIVPAYRLTIGELMKEFKISKKILLASIAPYGLSLLQHDYNPHLKQLKDIRSSMYKTKFHEAVRIWGTDFKLFANVPGGRKQMNIYGNPDSLISVIYDNAEFFNLSGSDMGHVILSKVFLKWENLPEDARQYYHDDIQRFEENADSLLSIIT